MPETRTELHPTVKSYRDAMDCAIEYARPHWEMFSRLYQLWRGRRFSALNSTISKIMINLFHTMVQDRLPKIVENVFSNEGFVTVTADNPQFEPFAQANELWLQDTLSDKVQLSSTIHPTLQTTLIGGTGYRMASVRFEAGRPVIGSRPLEFFHVLPCPTGGQVNPFDLQVEEAVPWILVIDWWTEDKIQELPKAGRNDDGIAGLLKQRPQTEQYPEDQYRDTYGTIGQFQYGGPASWRSKLGSVDTGDGQRQRRIVHWFRRDKHIIVGEDAFLLYEGPPILSNGYFPVSKYCLTNDLNNWFGISYMELLEDLIKAIVMNFNYRMDHALGVMFPVTWIRDDLRTKYHRRDFIPKPYDVKFFPTTVQDINKALFYDRRPDVSSDTFINEDRMKQLLQKVAGQTETTASMNDVVGNRTATGVTSILSELAGRPNMESLIIEHQGLRPEASLLLMFASQYFTERDGFTEFVRTPGHVGQWTELDPEDLTDNYTVHTKGTRFMAEKNMDFQRLLAMYPYWSQSPDVNSYELTRQSMDVVDVLPAPDRVVRPPQPEANPDVLSMLGLGSGVAGGAAGVQQPGGMSSQQDIRQPARSTSERDTPEPGTGRPVTAALRV